MARRSGYRGVTRLRRVMRRLEPELVDNLKGTVEQVATEIEQNAIFLVAPHRWTGDLLESIGHKVSRDGLTAVIGPGSKGVMILKRKAGSPFARRFDVKMSAATKRDIWNFTKGWWLEFGTKDRKTKSGASKGSVQASPFMGPAYRAVEVQAKMKIKKDIRDALTAARKKGGPRV